MNKALNAGYSASPATFYGPGIVNPSNVAPPAGASNPGARPMKPIDNESDFSE